jgi:hypothetical protein
VTRDAATALRYGPEQGASPTRVRVVSVVAVVRVGRHGAHRRAVFGDRTFDGKDHAVLWTSTARDRGADRQGADHGSLAIADPFSRVRESGRPVAP